jgi:hypothetical protein
MSWRKTVLEDDREGYEEYTCSDCRTYIELGIRIKEVEYTGNDNVYPYEES